MSDKLVLQTSQPLAKLAQANMALISQFALSPEVMGQSVTMVQGLIEQGQKSAIKLAQSHAFAHMMEGLLQNYTDFMTEMTHSAMGAMNAMAHQQKALVERTA